MARVGVDTFFQTLNENLEPRVQTHLQRVYACFSMSLLAAAAGGYLHLFSTILHEWGGMVALASIGFLLALVFTPHEQKNIPKRVGYLMGFAFSSGVSMGPLLDHVIRIDPSIISTAFLGSAVVFICFSLAALMNNNRKFLYMGGILTSALSILLLTSIMNIFIGSMHLLRMNLFIGLAVMCGFILYDTQLIVEKTRRGDTDFVWHCLDLFIDFIGVFRRLLILLSQKEDRRSRD